MVFCSSGKEDRKVRKKTKKGEERKEQAVLGWVILFKKKYREKLVKGRR